VSRDRRLARTGQSVKSKRIATLYRTFYTGNRPELLIVEGDISSL